LVFIASAQAWAHERAAYFDIPAQDLSAALLEFAREAPAELLVPTAPLAGAASTEVRGYLTPSAALARLLRCSGFVGSLDRGVVRLKPARAGAPALSRSRRSRRPDASHCEARREPLVAQGRVDASSEPAAAIEAVADPERRRPRRRLEPPTSTNARATAGVTRQSPAMWRR
jgi:hypothetical protein